MQSRSNDFTSVRSAGQRLSEARVRADVEAFEQAGGSIERLSRGASSRDKPVPEDAGAGDGT